MIQAYQFFVATSISQLGSVMYSEVATYFGNSTHYGNHPHYGLRIEWISQECPKTNVDWPKLDNTENTVLAIFLQAKIVAKQKKPLYLADL